MARRDSNLAGLAALGALGYALSDKGKKIPVEDRVGTPVSKDDRDFAAMDASLATMRPQRGNQISEEVMAEDGTLSPMRRNLETGELYNPNKTPAAPKSAGKKSMASAKKPYSMASDTVDENVKYRYSKTDTGDETARLAARYPKNKPMTLDERVAQIPSDKGKYAPVSGEKIDSTEIGRRANNVLNATAGLSIPGYVNKMTQAGYNARAAARRAAGDLTEAEIAAAKAAQQAKREDKTLNPNAWLAGPKGMAENFKKGGAVKAKPAKPAAKGWGQARGARGAKYY